MCNIIYLQHKSNNAEVGSCVLSFHALHVYQTWNAFAFRLDWWINIHQNPCVQRLLLKGKDLVTEIVETVHFVPRLCTPEKFLPLQAGLRLGVGQHGVARHGGRPTYYGQPPRSDASLEVVVLTSPTEEFVGETVKLVELICPYCDGTAKEIWIRQHKTEDVDRRTQVAGKPLAAVQVSRVDGQEVDVVEDEAAVAVPSQGFGETDVEQFSTIECVPLTLLDYKHAVL